MGEHMAEEKKKELLIIHACFKEYIKKNRLIETVMRWPPDGGTNSHQQFFFFPLIATFECEMSKLMQILRTY